MTEALERPDQCVAIAGAVGDSSASDITIMKYCVPSLPSAGVRRVSSETWSVPGSNQILNSILSIQFLDLVQGNSILVLREATDEQQQFQSRLDLFVRGDTFLGDNVNRPFVESDRLASFISLSANNLESINLQSIQGILVQPQTSSQKQANQAMLYMHIMASVSASDAASSASLYSNMPVSVFRNQQFNLCGLVSLRTRGWSARQCDVKLWEEINGRQVHPVFVEQDILALIPPGGGNNLLSSTDGQIHFVQLLPATSVSLISPKRYSRPFKASNWALTSGIPAVTSGFSNMFGFSTVTKAIVRKTQQLSQVGLMKEFAQGAVDIFDDGVDISVMNRVPTKVSIFMSNNPTSPTHWLSEVRLDLPVTGETTAASYMSQEVGAQMEMKQKCNYQTCNGCVDLNVQRLCYGAQQCTIARCIGTLTNQNRPLCGIGKTAEALYTTQVSLVHGGYMIVTETVSTVVGFGLKNFEGSEKIGILRWMDDAFFSTMCAAKDAIAGFVSILTSVINFVVQSVTQKPATYLEMGAQRVDSNFQAMFTLVITSFSNLLNQILLGILYPYFALQKTTICQLNTVMAFVDITGYKVTIGMPEVQVIIN